MNKKTAVATTPSESDLNQVIPALYSSMSVSVNGHILPKPGDDLQYEFGLNIYPKMLQEPVLAALDDIVRMLVLEADPVFPPAIKEPESESDPNFEETQAEHEAAKEVSDYVTELLKKRFKTPLRAIFWQMLEGYGQAHKLAEKVFGIDNGAVQVVDLKPKPRKMYSLTVNPFYDVLGVKAGVSTIGMITDLKGFDFQNDWFPIDRFWLFTPRMVDGNPMGHAALRPCYAPWYEKLLTRPESLKFMRQFGGGMVSLELPVITDKNKTVQVGDQLIDRQVYYQSLAQTFAANGGAFTLENGAKLELHVPDSEGQAFEAKFDRCDREMALAFVKSVRAILEAQHGSKADSETSLGLLKSLVNWLRGALCDSFNGSVIRTIVELAFGQEAVDKYLPCMTMEESKEEDIPTLLTALSSALAAGVITPEQMPHWDRKLGQPVREVTDEEPTDPAEEEAPGKGATFRRQEKTDTYRQRLSKRYAKATHFDDEID